MGYNLTRDKTNMKIENITCRGSVDGIDLLWKVVAIECIEMS